jgi:hypothetical protein
MITALEAIIASTKPLLEASVEWFNSDSFDNIDVG